MSDIKNLTGYIASILTLAAMLLYPVLFILIYKTKGLFRWTNTGDMLAFKAKGSNYFRYAAYGLMIIYACAYCIIPLCLKTNQKPLFSDISAFFGLAFCACISLAYFIQLTSTRFMINSGNAEGLEQLTQANPHSVINSIIMLGWTLFFPLSTLALALVFDASTAGSLCRIFCIMNSVFMFTAAGAFIADKTVLLMITMYPCLGLSTIGLAACLMAYFHK